MRTIYTVGGSSLALILALAAAPALAAGEYGQSGSSQPQSGMSGSGASGAGVSRSGMDYGTTSFNNLDKDGNGQVSKQEAQKGNDQLSQQWDEFDSNQDGQLDRAEFAAFESARQSPRSQGGMGTQQQGGGTRY
jgi:hypothetical protein